MFWVKQRSTSSPSRLCCSSFSVSVSNFATSPNSGVKFLGGFLRSDKSILRFIFSGCASFCWFFLFFCCDRATRRDDVPSNITMPKKKTDLRTNVHEVQVAQHEVVAAFKEANGTVILAIAENEGALLATFMAWKHKAKEIKNR